jgi:hypothetical protein
MSKVQSPCIGVCKFKRSGPAGKHCIGCSMTKDQKSLAKKARKRSAAEAFVALVVAQQQQMGPYKHWRPAYLKRCLRKGRPVANAVREAD